MTSPNSTARAFETARSEGRAALVGYLPAGFPDVPGAIEALRVMVDSGCDVIEVGLPYSDPVMDGPTIQAAAQQALEGGIRTTDVLRTVEAVAATGIPTVVMTYWNPVEQYGRASGASGRRSGVERFAADLAAAGGAGLITPDLTPDSADEWVAAADAHDLDKIFLVAPSSTEQRLRYTVEACRGFVYATAVMGVTGTREASSDLAGPLVARTRLVTDLPVGVGLGVSNGDQAAEVAAYADGVIVGSAFVRALLDATTTPRASRLSACSPRTWPLEYAVVRALLGVLLALVLTGCGSSESESGPPVTGVSIADDDGYRGILLDEAYDVPEVALTATDGQPFDLAAQSRRTLVFFGYTHCPDTCQVVMSTLAGAYAKLSDSERAQVQVAYITTDPARDTGPVLRDYLDRFNPEFVGVTGALPRIIRLGKPMDIDIAKGEKLPSGGYEVDHTAHVVAVNDARGDLLWTVGTSPAEMAEDLRKILKEDA